MIYEDKESTKESIKQRAIMEGTVREKRKILIVDDVEMNRIVLEEIIKNMRVWNDMSEIEAVSEEAFCKMLG